MLNVGLGLMTAGFKTASRDIVCLVKYHMLRLRSQKHAADDHRDSTSLCSDGFGVWGLGQASLRKFYSFRGSEPRNQLPPHRLTVSSRKVLPETQPGIRSSAPVSRKRHQALKPALPLKHLGPSAPKPTKRRPRGESAQNPSTPIPNTLNLQVVVLLMDKILHYPL